MAEAIEPFAVKLRVVTKPSGFVTTVRFVLYASVTTWPSGDVTAVTRLLPSNA